MFKVNDTTYHLNQATGRVRAAKNDEWVPVDESTERAARQALIQWQTAFGYACAMQDALSSGRDTARAIDFAESYARDVFDYRTETAYQLTNVADAYRAWVAHNATQAS